MSSSLRHHCFVSACLLGPWLGLGFAGLWPLTVGAHGDLDLRVQAVSQQLRTNSTNAALWLERADLHRRHRDFLAALTDLTAAEQLRPRWVPVMLQRARVLADAGQPAGAIKAASECLTLDEGNADARVIRARCWAELGELTAAIADLDLVLAAPARPLPDLYLERARWQFAAGKPAAAVQGLEAGLARLGQTPSLLLPAIEYAQQAGDPAGALAQLEQARRFLAGPDYEFTRSNFLCRVTQSTVGSSDVVLGASRSALYEWLDSALTRGPYLQSSTTNSIVIRWRTDVAVASRVIYGTNLASLEFTNLDLSIGTEHIVTLTNLQSDTRYYYAVGDAVENLAGPDADHFFLTHPLPQSTKDLRVWVIGDAGTKSANQQAVRDAFINFNGTNLVHAWLQLGDNAYDTGTDAEYQAALFNVYPTLLRSSVTWPALGNHDTAYGTAFVDTYPYFDIFTLPAAGEAGGAPSGTEHYYSFDLGMAHFICLDSMTASRATNGAMATWLRADLAVNSNRWTIAYWHHPPYSKGSHDSDPGGLDYEDPMGEMRTNFLPILEAGGVDLVLAGHSHSYERSYLIAGHYGTSDTFNSTNVVQSGSGRETNGLGAYLKPDGLGESSVGNRGAIYIVAGSSGQLGGGALNHVAMFTSQNVLGSLVLDFHTNRLEALFLPTNGVPTDWFTIIKQGTYPPQLTNASMLPGGELQFTVLSRAYRTNIIEATSSLLLPDWTGIATNLSTNAAFEVLDAAAPGFTNRFYRVHRP